MHLTAAALARRRGLATLPATLAPGLMPGHFLKPRDHLLYRGALVDVVLQHDREEWTRKLQEWPMSRERAEAALPPRLLLRTASSLEGWAVALSRWMLEAAATGHGQPGPAAELFVDCEGRLNPSPAALLRRVRRAGSVARSVVAKAIGQCAPGLWKALAEQGGRTTERTRYHWYPLHYVAAFGSTELTASLLDLGVDPLAYTAAGLTPLHIAVAYGSVGAADAIATLFPKALDAADKFRRTPVALALDVSTSASRCAAMLKALERDGMSAGQRSHLCAEALRLKRERADGERMLRARLPPECRDGGGWLEDGGGGDGDDDDDDDDGDDGDGDGGDGGDGDGQTCRIVSAIDPETLMAEYLSLSTPLIVRGGVPSSRLYSQWRRDAFATRHADVVLSPEPFPYASASAYLYRLPEDNSSTIRRLVGGGARGFGGHAARDGGWLPHGVFNALSRWKWSGPSNARPGGDRTIHGDVTPLVDGAPASSRDNLLRDFERPPFVEDERWLLRTASIQFYLGPAGSGAQPHWHGPAWNHLVYGRKAWTLWPPADAIYTQRHTATSAETAPANRSASASASGSGSGSKPAAAPVRCVQRAGDVLVVPELWGHATRNLQPSIGWASELSFDHGYDSGMGREYGDEWWRLGEDRPDEDEDE